MDKIEFLPLGSVVVIKGSVKKFMIIARALGAKIGSEANYFDYGGVLYPEGLTGDNIMYFQHEDIAKVVFEGLNDDDNSLMVENLNDWVAHLDMPRGDISKLKDAAAANA